MDIRDTVEELCERAQKRDRPFFTPFVSAEDAERALAIARVQGLELALLGGRENAERVRICALPSAYFSVSEESAVRALYLRAHDGKKYSHRDYLGSLMSLGIERDVIGDILPVEGGAYLFTVPEMADYLVQNIDGVSRTGCTATAVGLEDVVCEEGETEEVTVSVTSLRVDCVVCALFHLSREQALTLIERGLLRVNGEICLKPERRLTLPCRLVLRGFGMAEAAEELGASKRGKLRLRCIRY